jgi:hypothetical protein
MHSSRYLFVLHFITSDPCAVDVLNRAFWAEIDLPWKTLSHRLKGAHTNVWSLPAYGCIGSSVPPAQSQPRVPFIYPVQFVAEVDATCSSLLFYSPTNKFCWALIRVVSGFWQQVHDSAIRTTVDKRAEQKARVGLTQDAAVMTQDAAATQDAVATQDAAATQSVATAKPKQASMSSLSEASVVSVSNSGAASLSETNRTD